MRYYQCEQYPIEFVLSENIDKRFDAHNHVRHYVISVVMQGVVKVSLENQESEYHRGDLFLIPPYIMHSVRQGKDTRLLSMCMGTSFVENTAIETAEGIVQDLLRDAAGQGIFGREEREKLFSSVRAVYCLRDKERKETDADIKTLADKMISHPERDLSIEALATDIFVSNIIS